MIPLWQLEHVPLTTLWSIRALAHCVVTWQVSQLALVGICRSDRPTAFTPLWQPTQSVGVPLNLPPRWHEVQSTRAWAPVRGNPVRKWSNLSFRVCAIAKPLPSAANTATATINLAKANTVDDATSR
jgi:hypothetical protein